MSGIDKNQQRATGPAAKGPVQNAWSAGTLSSAKRWYAVQTQNGREGLAVSNLARQGFEVFYPTMLRTIRHARQFHQRRMPLFPGYLFVQLNPHAAAWRSINGTRGVSALVTMGNNPAEVPDDVVGDLTRLCDVEAPATGVLHIGDPVRLMAGPFAEMVGTVLRLNAKGRIEVLLQILGMSVTVKARTAQNVPIPVAI